MQNTGFQICDSLLNSPCNSEDSMDFLHEISPVSSKDDRHKRSMVEIILCKRHTRHSFFGGFLGTFGVPEATIDESYAAMSSHSNNIIITNNCGSTYFFSSNLEEYTVSSIGVVKSHMPVTSPSARIVLQKCLYSI